MQSVIFRRSALAASRARLPMQTSQLARRTYADTHNEGKGDYQKPPASSGSSYIPMIAAGAFVILIPSYYIFSSDKPAGSEQAFIKELRREKGGAQGEYHDPRDSGVKTLEQKKAKEAKEGK